GQSRSGVTHDLCLTSAPCPCIAGDDCSEHCNLAHGSCDQDGKCRCDPGWEGEYCEECVRMPGCLHGTCHQPWQCICHSGWAGKFCDKDVHICEHQSPCQNGAQCVYDRDGDYSCLCPEGFHGKDCEMKAGPCEKAGSPCKNGGQCQDENGFASNFTCRCLAGFVGAFCEHDVDDCLMRPCANGATCHDGINRFSCQCQVGFEGLSSARSSAAHLCDWNRVSQLFLEVVVSDAVFQGHKEMLLLCGLVAMRASLERL
uniref:Delta like non-canonical Notch ligand 2 n=1 Tax=Phasianus colchicus TaxID=9054 RepID=A0A669NYP5_PHACC